MQGAREEGSLEPSKSPSTAKVAEWRGRGERLGTYYELSFPTWPTTRCRLTLEPCTSHVKPFGVWHVETDGYFGSFSHCWCYNVGGGSRDVVSTRTWAINDIVIPSVFRSVARYSRRDCPSRRCLHKGSRDEPGTSSASSSERVQEDKTPREEGHQCAGCSDAWKPMLSR